MSRNSRRSQRRAATLRRAEQKSWFRRYLRSLRGGVAAASIGAATIGSVGWLAPPAFAANDTWIGNTSNQWSAPANWSALPATGDTLEFGVAGTAGATLIDNLMTAATYNVAGITFDPTAPAYIVNPGTAGTNSFTLTGNITDNSTATQTINDDIALGAVRTVTAVAGGTVVLGGTLSGAGGVTTAGPGALTLAGPVNYTGATTVSAGTLNIAGAMGATTAAGPITVGNTANVNGILNISANITSSSNIVIGGQLAGNATGANAIGAVYQTAGTFNSTTGASVNAFQLGGANAGYGYYKLSGGTLISNEIGIGGGNQNNTGATGVMDITGGTFTENGWITICRGQNQIGVLNITGGAVTFGTNGGTQMYIGGGTETAPYFGQINLTNATLTAQGNRPLNLANSAIGGAMGVFNLNAGGVLTIGTVTAGAGTTTSLFNFNGGTLKPVVGVTNFISSANLTAVTVYSGGGTIDNSGFNIAIANPLVAPTGSGVNAVAVSNGGSGYIGAPAVLLSGGSGIGATAVATINPTTGVVTGITVTSPGSGYTPGDILTATLSGGGATTPATIGNITLSPNVGGGMTFTGSGVTTLTSTGAVSGQSTYTGPTAINGGTLLISGGAGVNGSSGITVGTAANPATLIVTGSTPVSPTVTLTNGTVNGAFSTINALTVANSVNNVVSNGNSGTATLANPLNIGALTFNGAATLSPVTSLVTASTPALAVTTLTASGAAGSVKVSPISTAGGFPNGTYQLVSYTGSIGGTGFPAFSLVISGLGVRQTATLTNPAGLIDLVVGGDSAVWTGALNGNWTTAVLAAPRTGALVQLRADRLRHRRRRHL